MKQDIITYLTDSFIDFEGKEHKIIACALSQSPITTSKQTLKIGWINLNETIDTNSYLYHDVYRMVTIGIAICNPDDVFNEEVGKKIAYNKAANMESAPRIYTTTKGVITKELVDAFLKQQIKFCKENPEYHIKGYKEAKNRYEQMVQTNKIINNFTKKERKIFDLAVQGFNFNKYIDLAKTYVKNIMNENK